MCRPVGGPVFPAAMPGGQYSASAPNAPVDNRAAQLLARIQNDPVRTQQLQQLLAAGDTAAIDRFAAEVMGGGPAALNPIQMDLDPTQMGPVPVPGGGVVPGAFDTTRPVAELGRAIQNKQRLIAQVEVAIRQDAAQNGGVANRPASVRLAMERDNVQSMQRLQAQLRPHEGRLTAAHGEAVFQLLDNAAQTGIFDHNLARAIVYSAQSGVAMPPTPAGPTQSASVVFGLLDRVNQMAKLLQQVQAAGPGRAETLALRDAVSTMNRAVDTLIPVSGRISDGEAADILRYAAPVVAVNQNGSPFEARIAATRFAQLAQQIAASAARRPTI